MTKLIADLEAVAKKPPLRLRQDILKILHRNHMKWWSESEIALELNVRVIDVQRALTWLCQTGALLKSETGRYQWRPNTARQVPAAHSDFDPFVDASNAEECVK